ncbi:hypothetical protein [Flagellimonas eckloniae]|uniref:Uncharacterized protein n=1 Tax=Flagellimonas eckloniae TaxID=346185 RepID=A0A0Q0XKS7_9FLAO|nr:hypothetical protein [Allomuricauda eckloniae]KQC31494.1 hypothetical protein AAY42_17655 [Allomuricauda eckloniae]
MNIEELGKKELELYSRISNLNGSIEDKSDKVVYFGITKDYREIHQEYSRLAKKNLEALKRGLFIMWYALTEPVWLSGMGELDSEAELRIIKLIDRRLKRDVTDYELDWMLDYYSDWDYAFEKFSAYKNLQNRLKRKSKTELPDEIDVKEMERRGRMGLYWNSLTNFNK